MKHTAPPPLLEFFLLLLLPPQDRETISGDLHEEFVALSVPGLGGFRAYFWYIRQILSFAPRKAVAVILQRTALRLLCFCTALAGCWLGMMDLLLRHPGYRSQLVIAATIVSQALLTLTARRFSACFPLRVATIAGSVALLWLSGSALKAAFSGAHLEGYVLLIALALIVQVALTVTTLPRLGNTEGRVHDAL